jgi:hypothetical protein
VSTEYQLTWKREERGGRSYWHIYDRAGNRVRNIIGIEGQLIEEIERLRKIENAARNYIGVMFLSDHQPGEALAKLHDLVEGYADDVPAEGGK